MVGYTDSELTLLPQTQSGYNCSWKNYPRERTENCIKRTPTTRDSLDWGRRGRNSFWKEKRHLHEPWSFTASQTGATLRYTALPGELETSAGVHSIVNILQTQNNWDNCNGEYPEKLWMKAGKTQLLKDPSTNSPISESNLKSPERKMYSPLVKTDSPGRLWVHLGERWDLTRDWDIGGSRCCDLVQVCWHRHWQTSLKVCLWPDSPGVCHIH